MMHILCVIGFFLDTGTEDAIFRVGGETMRKMLICLLLIPCLLLAGCGSSVPEALTDARTVFTEIKDHIKAEYTVPNNYRHLRDNFYAVLNEEEQIIGYVKLVKSDGYYKWEDCMIAEVYKQEGPATE